MDDPAPLPLEAIWQADGDAHDCPLCTRDFSVLRRRHHCRYCGRVVCDDCSRVGTVPVRGGPPGGVRPRACRTCEARAIVLATTDRIDPALLATTVHSIPSGVLESLDAEEKLLRSPAADIPTTPSLAQVLLDAAAAEVRQRHFEEKRQFIAGVRRKGVAEPIAFGAAPHLESNDPLDPIGWAPGKPSDSTLPSTWRDLDAVSGLPRTVLGDATVQWLQRLSFAEGLLFKWIVALPLTSEYSVAAATKFLSLRKLCFAHRLQFRIDDADVVTGLRLGVFHTTPLFEPTQGCPVIAQLPRRLVWAQPGSSEGVSPETMIRAWFYATLAAASTGPSAQTVGFVLITDCDGAAFANVNKNFMRPMQSLMLALPMRVRRVVVGNEPGWFRSILWPVIRAALSEKMRERVAVIGSRRWTDGEPSLATLPASCVPTGLGGTRDMESPEAIAAMMAALKMAPLHLDLDKSSDSVGGAPYALELTDGASFRLTARHTRAVATATALPDDVTAIEPPLSAADAAQWRDKVHSVWETKLLE